MRHGRSGRLFCAIAAPTAADSNNATIVFVPVHFKFALIFAATPNETTDEQRWTQIAATQKPSPQRRRGRRGRIEKKPAKDFHVVQICVHLWFHSFCFVFFTIAQLLFSSNTALTCPSSSRSSWLRSSSRRSPIFALKY